jgi:hypothetical protein
VVDRWWDTLGRVNDGVAPGKAYRDLFSWYGILMSENPLTYCDELINEVSVRGGKGKGRSDCLHSLTGVKSYYTAFHKTEHVP